MKDWKGNDIKVGDTVSVVFIGSPIKGNPIKKSNSFDVVIRYNITESGPFLTYAKDKPSKLPINLIDIWLNDESWQIICIEGVSDNKEEYYKSIPV